MTIITKHTKSYHNPEQEFKDDFKANYLKMSNDTLLRHFNSFADEMSTNGVFLFPVEMKLAYKELIARKVEIPERKFAVDFCKEIYKVNKF